MGRKRRAIWTGLLLAFLAGGTAGCLDALPRDGRESSVRETIGGSFHILWDVYTGLDPALLMIEPLKAAHPDAEFDDTDVHRLHHEVSRPELNYFGFSHYRVIAENTPADLYFFEDTMAPLLFASGYLAPLDEFAETDPLVQEALSPEVLERVREQGDGRLYAIPVGKNAYGLFYNEDIFDELGLPPPTDGMTWDEVTELARRIMDHPLIGDRKALGVPNRHLAFSQMGGRFSDPETGFPDFSDPVWERYEDYLDSLLPLGPDFSHLIISDFANKKLAMYAGHLHGLNAFMAPYANWDIASFPVFADAPDTGPAPGTYYVGIPQNSLRKPEAFRLIARLLSDETQLNISRYGIISIRSEPMFREAYGEWALGSLGKRVSAFFHHPREARLDADYDHLLQSDFYHYGASSYTGFYDFHEMLRNAYGKILETRQRVLDLAGDPADASTGRQTTNP